MFTSAMRLAILAGASAAAWTICMKLGSTRIMLLFQSQGG